MRALKNFNLVERRRVGDRPANIFYTAGRKIIFAYVQELHFTAFYCLKQGPYPKIHDTVLRNYDLERMIYFQRSGYRNQLLVPHICPSKVQHLRLLFEHLRDGRYNRDTQFLALDFVGLNCH